MTYKVGDEVWVKGKIKYAEDNDAYCLIEFCDPNAAFGERLWISLDFIQPVKNDMRQKTRRSEYNSNLK